MDVRVVDPQRLALESDISDLPGKAQPSRHPIARLVEGTGEDLSRSTRPDRGQSVELPLIGRCEEIRSLIENLDRAAVISRVERESKGEQDAGPEDRLLPAVRAEPADSVLVASGVSCREQIEHATGRRALHPAQVLREALRRDET